MHNFKGPELRLAQQPRLLNTRFYNVHVSFLELSGLQCIHCQLCLWLYGKHHFFKKLTSKTTLKNMDF